jgi:hypothetical protein
MPSLLANLLRTLTRGPQRARGAAPARTRDCPDCGATILAAARICRHCRTRLDGWDELVERVSA